MAFHIVDEIAKWIEVWDIEPRYHTSEAKVGNSTKCSWAVESAGGYVVMGDSPEIASRILPAQKRACKIDLYYLPTLAADLATELVEELGGKQFTFPELDFAN